MKFFRSLLILCLVASLSACATYEPESSDEAGEPEVVGTEIQSNENVEARENEVDEENSEDEQIREAAETIDGVAAEVKGENVVLTLRESILFDSLSAELKRESHSTLDEIAKLLPEYPERMVLVAGHTDDRPTRTSRFPSNWDLSAQRAVNVVKYLRHHEKLENSRLIAAGFGKHHPLVSNSSPENRRLNRRVEIILLPKWEGEEKIKLSAP